MACDGLIVFLDDIRSLAGATFQHVVSQATTLAASGANLQILVCLDKTR